MSRDAIATTWPATEPAPRVWVLLGDKAGDNEQCLAVAEALGWPYDVKRLAYNRRFRRWNVRLGATLTSLDRERSDPLAPPWPDLVVGVGRRSVPVARWIRRQHGDATRLVQLGRPRAPLGWFDLVVTTPQYGLPDRANVVTLALPPVRRRVPDPVASWPTHLPRPWIALLVGGRGDPFTVDAAAAARLGRETSTLAEGLRGSLLVVTSRRTEAAAVAALAASLRAPHLLHRWSPDPPSNPYPSLLAEADRFVVTGDSMSMLADAVATGKPVALFPGSYRPRLIHRLRRLVEALGPLHRWAHEAGLVARPRRLDDVHRALLAGGRVTMLGSDACMAPRASSGDELAEVVARIRRMMQDTAS